MEALRLLHRVEDERRYASPTEQKVLAQWSSWGAVPQIFEEHREEWAAERAQLKQLLSAEEYAQASATTINAHYTDPAVVKAVWDVLEGAGFAGGPVLEPGCGAGTFIGLAPETATMAGVELDGTTARIASLLYPSAQVRAEGFEQSTLPEGSVSAVVGNVPFGDYVVHDDRYNTARLSIHNYFIAKSLRMVAPGGYVAVLSSTFTMDAQGTRARRQIAKHGDLVGAVRLPNGAFKAVAGTDVATDLLVFRRRKEGETPDEARINAWVNTSTTWATHRQTGEPTQVSIGGHFAANDDALLGVLSVGQGMFNENALELSGPAGHQLADVIRENLSSQLAEAVTDGYGYAPDTVDVPAEAFSPGLRYAKGAEATTGTIRYTGAGFERFNAGQAWEPVRVAKASVTESLALLWLRDAARAVIDSQRAGAPETERSALRAALNDAYDAYDGEYGPINRFILDEKPRAAKAVAARLSKSEREWRLGLPADGDVDPAGVPVPEELRAEWETLAAERVPVRKQEHLKFLSGDPARGLLLALESFDEASGTATKTVVFDQDVLAFRERPETAATAADALAVSLDESRGVDLARIGSLLGVEEAQAREMLGTLVFDDPVSGDLLPAVAYLSGDVRSKLDAARGAAGTDERFLVNVEALEGAMPDQVTAMDITARPGVRYVDPEDYEAFIAEKFGVAATAGISPTEGAWELRAANGSPKYAPEVRFTYATADRTPLTLLQSVMNNRTIVIRRTIYNAGSERTVKDVKATLEARDKAARIANDFGEWLFQDAGRAERVTATYNRMFNSHTVPDYAGLGESMSFPGLANDRTPHPYQRSAVARILNEPAVLLDHVVGAGKTGTMVIAAMELRRTGIAKKPAIVVPNHLVEQVSREFIGWYPSARVLSIPSGIDAKDRAFWVAAAATGDWDAVVIPQTVFGNIRVDPAKTQEWLEEQIKELRAARAGMGGDEKARIKAVERAIKRIEERHARITTGKDNGVTFEESGIDYLFVDEAHHFKNLHRQSDSYELACDGSDKASDLDFKLRALRETKIEDAKRGGYYQDGFLPAVATFATGTPVANSMSEMWVMQHYLRPDLLSAAGLEDVNSWANQFTERSTVLRISPAGGGYDQVERINKYINLPELLSLSTQFSDVVTVSDITAKLPVLAGGERVLEKRQPSGPVVDYVKELGERAKNLSGVDPKEDNMPKITNDGRMVALDPRLKDLPGDPDGGRPGQVAAAVWAIHQDTKDRQFTGSNGEPSPVAGGLQLLFCDRAVPNTEGRFSMYQAIKDQLMDLGMEPERIAFIHEAGSDTARKDLFDKCRDGRVNVLIGSTEKMGTGTNVQDRAVALHHVDVPWRPADLEQREGRILRQGNQNDDVSIRSYATAETFDVYMWDMIARKAGFINQLKRGDVQGRTMDDGFGDLELSAGQAAAALSGDPRLERLASMQMEESRLQSLHRSFQDAKRRSKGELAIAHSALSSIAQDLPGISAAAGMVTDTAGDRFVMSVGGRQFRERRDAAEAFKALVTSRIQPLPAGAGPYQTLGEVAGLAVDGRYHRGLELRLGGSDAATVRVEWDAVLGTDPLGLVRRLENTAAAAPEIRDQLLARQADVQASIPALEQTQNAVFEHAAELSELQQRISELMHDMGLDQGEEDANPAEAATVSGDGLAVLVRDPAKVHGSDLRAGDIVTGIKGHGQGLFRVETVSRNQESILVAVVESDEAPEPVRIGIYQDVVLVSRPVAVLTPFEKLFVDVAPTDAVATADMEVKSGERITVERRTLDPDTARPTGEVRMVTGVVEVRSNDWLITREDGSTLLVGYNRWGHGSPVLRHGVVDPDAAVAESVGGAGAVVNGGEFLPGDVLLEDVPGLGERGDVSTGRSYGYGFSGFIDPETGADRSRTGNFTPRPVAYQQGRPLTSKEVGQLFPDGCGGTIDDLRAGDVVPAHELDRNQARRDNVTVTSVSGGTMRDVMYRFEDGNTGKCRRREDQNITILARRYGALTLLERAELQAPGRVSERSADSLTAAHTGSWVRVKASRGTLPAWNNIDVALGRIVTVDRVAAADNRTSTDMRLELEHAGGTRTKWAAHGNATVLLWEGELPETPLDFSGLDLELAPVHVDPAPVAAADLIADPDPFLSEHLMMATVDIAPARTGPKPEEKSAEGTAGPVTEITPEEEPATVPVPALSHSTAGTSVSGVGRENTALHALLKEAGFKFSRRQDLWYLNSTWKPGTRDARVQELLRVAEQEGIDLGFADTDGTRRMGMLRAGDTVRIAPGKAVIHGVDRFGIHQATTDVPELVATVGGGRITDHRTPVEVTVAGQRHRFEISHTSGALELVSQDDAARWMVETAPSLESGLSAKLDAIAGRRVGDVQSGQRISVSGKPVTLEYLHSYGHERYDDARVLAVAPGPVDSTRYLLLEQATGARWIQAHSADVVPVTPAAAPRGNYRAPRFTIVPPEKTTLGRSVSASGIRTSTAGTRIPEELTVAGRLTAIDHRDDGSVDLTITTGNGAVMIRQGIDGQRPEVTILHEGSTTPDPVNAASTVPAGPVRRRSARAQDLRTGDVMVNDQGQKARVVDTRQAGAITEILVASADGNRGIIKAGPDRRFAVEPSVADHTEAATPAPVTGPDTNPGPSF